MRSKLMVAIVAGSFLFAGVSTAFAQEKVAVKEAKEVKEVKKEKVEKTVVKKEMVKKVKAKKANAEKCTEEEKASCAKECGHE